MKLAPLSPATRALLRRYRLLARESVVPNLSGGQLMRRKGQSLEFREYAPYMPGDDIRFVDWRASARYGAEHELLVRSFLAEERMRVLVSVDPRATMRLPAALPKLQVALWVAEAMQSIAGADDEVAMHWLFAPTPRPPAPLRSAEQLYQQYQKDGLLAALGEEAPLNLQHLRDFLPPTAIWIVVSDLYFASEAARRDLAAAMLSALAGMCWVLLIELDTWGHEQALLSDDVWQLDRPGAAPAPGLIQLTHNNIQLVEKRIGENRRTFLEQTRLPDEDRRRWVWPKERTLDPGRTFSDLFTGDWRVKELFARQSV